MPAEDPDDEDVGDQTPPEDPKDSTPGDADQTPPEDPKDSTPDDPDGTWTERAASDDRPATSESSGDGDEGDGETGAPPVGGEGERRPRPSSAGEEAEHSDLVGFVREVVTSVGTVLLVGVLLFAVSGVWPPLVAVESGSMEPHMSKGDLVFVAENGRYAPGDAVRGVVPYQQARDTGYWSFGDYGNVVVYQPDGRARTPVIHRARMYVEEDENWVERADPEYLGDHQTCAENVHCPADHSGFITKGDNNPRYDQVGTTEASTLSAVVKPEWIRGNAKVRLPKLGCIRLELSGIGCDYP